MTFFKKNQQCALGVIAFLTLGLTCAHFSHAQLLPKGRYERELRSADNGFTVVPLQENGIALIRDKNKYNDGKKLWELILLSADLQESWKSDLEIKSSFDLIGYEFNDKHVYFLFRENDKESKKFELAKLNIDSHQSSIYEIKHEFALDITHFTVVGENPLFGGYVAREPTVMLYETSAQLLKVIPGFFLKDTELLDLRINNNDTFNALLIEGNSLDRKHLVIKTFDQSGGLLLEDYIELEKDKNVLTGITSSLKREELIILGTYTEGLNKEAIGYFSVLVDPFSDQTIQYYPFTGLSRLLDYLPDKKANRLKSKSKERLDMGKNPSYKTDLLPIRVEETDEGFFLLSEMYDAMTSTSKPYWNNYNNPYYDYGYSPYSYNPFLNRRVTSPYAFNNSNQGKTTRMIESVLALFNPQGKLIWDNALVYDNLKRYSLEQTSDFTVKKNLIYLTYKKESKVYVSTSSTYMESELDTLDIPMMNPRDVVRYETEEDSGVRYWYNDAMFVWGYQSIKNREMTEADQVRYVFYINKFKAE